MKKADYGDKTKKRPLHRGVVLKTVKSTIYLDPYCGGSLKAEGMTIFHMVPLPFNASTDIDFTS